MLPATASIQTDISSPQSAITPLSHDYQASSESVSTISQSAHLLHFQHIESRIQPIIADHMQNRLEFNHSSHSNEIPVENQSIHLTHGNNYQLMFEQQSDENHYNSTEVIYSTNADYNDANHLSALWDDYINNEAPQYPYQRNYSEGNEYSNHFPSDFHSKCIGNYTMEENYNVICNV